MKFRSRLTHHGAEPTKYQVWIHPEYDIDSMSPDEKVITGYVRDQGEWKIFNQNYKVDRGPNDNLLRSAVGNGFAFFNHDANYGMAQFYDHDEIERPKFFWHPSRSQINLELYTKTKELKTGEYLDYGYTVKYLDKAPE